MPKAKNKSKGKNPIHSANLTFKEVDNLPANELNKLCKENLIDVKYGKTAKVNLLCSKLNISTTDGKENKPKPYLLNHNMTIKQLQEYEKLTPGYMASQTGWSKELKTIREIDDRTVKDYLCKYKIISESDLRQYKISRPYQLKEFVHSMKIHTEPLPSSKNFILLQAQCNPSQSSSEENVKVLFIILDAINSVPYGGYCTCTVGFNQSCGHIGAALFRIADLVASGADTIPEDPTCTEKLCKWTDPKGAAVKPKLLDNITVAKSDTETLAEHIPYVALQAYIIPWTSLYVHDYTHRLWVGTNKINKYHSECVFL